MPFSFAGKATVENLKDIPEQFQVFYKPDGEKFTLDSDNPVVGAAVKSISSLVKTVDKLRIDEATAKKGKVDMAPLSEWGTTPEEVAAKFVEEKSELAAKAPKSEEWQAKLAQQRTDMTNSHNAVLGARDTEITSLKSAVENELITSRSMTALAKHKGSAELLMPVIKNHVKVVKSETGAYSTQVVGDDGTQRFSATGESMSLDELVVELKANDVYSRAFESEAPSGANTRPGSTNQRTHRPGGGKDERTANDKISAGLTAGSASKLP